MDKKINHKYLRKVFIITTVFFTFLVFSIKFWPYYLKRKIPSFNMELIDGTQIDNKLISTTQTSIFFIKQLNAFTLNLLHNVHRLHNNTNNDVILIFDDSQDMSKVIDFNKFYIVKTKSWQYVTTNFYLNTKSENKILIYNYLGELIESLEIKPSNKRKILRHFEQPFVAQRGNLKNVSDQVLKEINHMKNGIYFITDYLCSTCFPFKVYEEMEEICTKKGERLQLILVGEWNKIDINNFLYERNNKINIIPANANIIDAIGFWKNETQRDQFNMAIIKSDKKIKVIPLIDYNDAETWYSYSQSMK